MNSIYDGRLLVVDDNEELCRMLTDMLHREGFRQVYTAGTCAQALSFFETAGGQAEMPDLVILDINLPDGDGFSLMREFRCSRNVPILFLSARDADEDRLHGLGLGADDYIVKPFLPQELVRRSYAAQLGSADNVLHLGETVVDWGSGSVTRGGKTMQLTAKEYALLRKLADNRGNIVTIDALCRAAWDDETFGYENTLMVHIRRLREKIEENPSKPRWLLTVRGLGYKLVKEEVQ